MRENLRNKDSENSDVLCEDKWMVRFIPTIVFLLSSVRHIKYCLEIICRSKGN